MDHQQPIFVLFNMKTMIKQINVKSDPTSIRRSDSNSQPLDLQPPPIALYIGNPLTSPSGGKVGRIGGHFSHIFHLCVVISSTGT